MVSFPRIKTHQNFSSQIRQNNLRIGKFENISLCKGNPPDAAQKGGKSQLLVLVISFKLQFLRGQMHGNLYRTRRFFPSFLEAELNANPPFLFIRGWKVGGELENLLLLPFYRGKCWDFSLLYFRSVWLIKAPSEIKVSSDSTSQ